MMMKILLPQINVAFAVVVCDVKLMILDLILLAQVFAEMQKEAV
jgi:hypothetical protein